MTVLEANQAYREAMTILKDARIAVYRENDELVFTILCHAERCLTDQEHRDMKASFSQ